MTSVDSDPPRGRQGAYQDSQTVFHGNIYGYTHTVHAHATYIGYLGHAGPGVIPNHADIHGEPEYPTHLSSYSRNTVPLSVNQGGGQSPVVTQPHEANIESREHEESYSGFEASTSSPPLTEHNTRNVNRPIFVNTTRLPDVNDELSLPWVTVPLPDPVNDDEHAAQIDDLTDPNNTRTQTPKRLELDLNIDWRYFKRMGRRLWKKSKKFADGFGRQSAP